ncbi:putative F-box protein At3g10240 [Triticum aestivum]|uniref:putative F-box protein At3g10240 n=1 Tax=Triticum aestivum TaxID=4565 RepID=UPI001D033FEE|nr:putative F-box protein At3g10240 [Triticum aestivum]
MPTSVPSDVVSEILSWAPVKSVCRFRCASRGWGALISDPAFVAAHKARTEPQLLIVANSFHGVASGGRRDLRLLDTDGSVVRVVKSAGNLWTIISGPRGPVCATRVGRVLNVINLATGDVLIERARVQLCYFIFSGYAAPSDKYKVVRLMATISHGHPLVHTCWVLALEDGARGWRRMQSPPIASYFGLHKNSTVTIDGVLYFLYSLLRGDYVLRLDLETEQWKRSIKAPEMRYTTPHMVELNGTLNMVHSEGRGTKHGCTIIWLLSDLAKGTWVKAYMIPMPETVDLVIPLKVMRHGGKLMCYYSYYLLSDKATPTLQVYDLLNETCTHLADLPGNQLADVGFCDLHLECHVRPT